MIKIDNLSFKYSQDGEYVLKDISLDIEKGEFICIVGHNGSGKSTLAKCLNGILLPSLGDIVVDQYNTKNEDTIIDIRKKVGMVFQNPDNQIVATIVEEDVAFGPENLSIDPAIIRKRIDFALNAVDMAKYANSTSYNLSGGQKQRVAIAGIIAMTPDYIVLDEATSMLDPKGRKEVLSTIKNLNKELKITVIHITHYMDEVVNADRVIVMSGGQIILDDTPKMAFANVSLLKEIGLDVPQITDLMFELRQNGLDVDYNLLTVEECAEEIKKICK